MQAPATPRAAHCTCRSPQAHARSFPKKSEPVLIKDHGVTPIGSGYALATFPWRNGVVRGIGRTAEEAGSIASDRRCAVAARAGCGKTERSGTKPFTWTESNSCAVVLKTVFSSTAAKGANGKKLRFELSDHASGDRITRSTSVAGARIKILEGAGRCSLFVTKSVLLEYIPKVAVSLMLHWCSKCSTCEFCSIAYSTDNP